MTGLTFGTGGKLAMLRHASRLAVVAWVVGFKGIFGDRFAAAVTVGFYGVVAGVPAGTVIHTSATHFHPIRRLPLQRWNGAHRAMFGGIIEGAE